MGAEPAHIPVRDPAVVARWAGTELVLLDTRTGVYSSTTGVGARAWELLDGRRGVDDLLRLLCRDYPMDEGTARRDVEAWLAKLACAGLLSWVEVASPSAPLLSRRPEGQRGTDLLWATALPMTTAEVVIALVRAGLALGPGVIPVRTEHIDWPAVLALADRHGVAPPLWRALAAAPTGFVPSSVLADLAVRLGDGVAAGLLREHALCQALNVAAAADVDVLVLKGAALAHSIYPRPELRPYADLDLLCRPDDYAKLHRALVTAGYASDDLATLPQRHSPLEGYPERAFSSPVAGVRVELHSGILELGLLEHSHDALWAAAQTVEVDGRRLPMLAPIHQILHLAVHVHRHGYRRLLWLDDLALAMHRWRDELDWPAVMRLARMEGAGAVLRHAVAVAHVVLGVSPPDLGPPTPEEVLLHTAYRILWPLGRAQQLQGEEHQRRLRFEPGTGSLLDVAPGLLLLGRRREKWRILRLYRRPRIRKTGRPF